MLRERAEDIVRQLRELVESLEEMDRAPDLRSKRGSLLGLTGALRQLQDKQIPVPDQLRDMRNELAREVAEADDVSRAIGYLRNELSALIARIGSCNRRRRTSTAGDKHPTTHRDELRKLILECLKDLGGRARSRDVLAAMATKLDGRLLPGDLETREGGELVWRNNARFERFRMIQDGLLRSDSPKGVWETSRAI